ncbi:N-acetylmuramoyl-L-alanine amidase-like domain-containing protein [Luteolibacter algae]|uniref:N-acetylmuramoyl-L-alanine amidase-like domain-containing protein n=1 Tax=Luteolibacter algae TaxID=454151 RepID=A0ABW5DB68_9BACT
MNKKALLPVLLAFGVVGCAGPRIESITMNGVTRLQVQAPGRQQNVPATSQPRLPLGTVFKGESKFYAIVAKAEREGWRKLPIGERTARIAREMIGVPYVNYSLEVDDKIESPVVSLTGMDCWTYYENALAISRMLAYKPGPYKPEDMLQMVEIERYRDGVCTGNYLSRLHHLEEVFHDNQRRGYAANITSRIPGARRMRREIKEMTVQWKNYRYLRNNPSLIEPMGKIEAQVSKLPVYEISKDRVRAAENYLQNGDICAITTTWKDGYTSHVGLIMRIKGRAYFCHATSDRDKGRMTIIDRPITDYLAGSSKHSGIVICRPFDVPPSPLWQKNVVGR